MGNTKSMSSVLNSSTPESATKKSARRNTLIYETKRFYLNLSELKSGMTAAAANDHQTPSARVNNKSVVANRPHSLIDSTAASPSSSSSCSTDEYTSLNEIIESIESFCREMVPASPVSQKHASETSSTSLLPRINESSSSSSSSSQVDNYANLDLDDSSETNKTSESRARPTSLLTPDLDSQLYSNIKLIQRESHQQHRQQRRRQQRQQKQQPSPSSDKTNSSLVQYLVNFNYFLSCF